jgi:adenylylsulfate kinase-like enzyme
MSRLKRIRKGITVVRYFAFWGAVALVVQIAAIRNDRMQNRCESNTTNK